MFKNMKPELKVGLFALLCIVIIAVITIKVGDRSIIAGGGYDMNVVLDTAIGIRAKTPVEISGIQVGVVKKIKLNEGGKALVTLGISNDVRLPEGTKAFVRAKGFLGETFIELRPGSYDNASLMEEAEIPFGGAVGDMNLLMSQFNEIAGDIKQVTGALKGMVGTDDSSPVYRAVNNLDVFTEKMKDLSVRNEEGFNKVVDNLAVLTQELKTVIQNRQADIDSTLANLSSITRKVDEGQGTVGKLINDDTTVNNLNSAVNSLSEAVGGLKKLETEIGYHTEYLGGTNDWKQYVHLNFFPRPDEGFLFEFVSDPSASPTRINRTTEITAGGVTSTVQTNTASVQQNQFRFSAELAKKFYNFTLRGGVIESTGGLGLDYSYGPASAIFSAFDFETKYGQKPHLKAWANVNLTKSLYLLGGADDFINPSQPVDWFVGAGFRLVDEDVKSVLGLATKAAK